MDIGHHLRARTEPVPPPGVPGAVDVGGEVVPDRQALQEGLRHAGGGGALGKGKIDAPREHDLLQGAGAQVVQADGHAPSVLGVLMGGGGGGPSGLRRASGRRAVRGPPAPGTAYDRIGHPQAGGLAQVEGDEAVEQMGPARPALHSAQLVHDPVRLVHGTRGEDGPEQPPPGGGELPAPGGQEEIGRGGGRTRAVLDALLITGHRWLAPPSTARSATVMWRAMGETRNSTTPATSWAEARRPSGTPVWKSRGRPRTV